MLNENVDFLHTIAERLVQQETITGQEILDILQSAPQT
jgi:ATP-dependent Zn protease